jgi:cell division septation protein DedD
MHGVFEEDEVEPVERRPDTEVTLGPMLLLGLFFGLVLLCGLCFGLGYSMGSRGAREASTAVQQPGDPASSQAAGSLSKPSAVSQSIPTPQTPAAELASSGASSGVNPTTTSQDSGSTSAGDANSAQPVVKPALPAAATTPVPTSVSAQPALALKSAPATALMVQIATVSHQEDADVLVGALHKRGYAVTARRDPVDNQFHVRVGPFNSRNDANAMRQKLLRDGYNAIVQP